MQWCARAMFCSGSFQETDIGRVERVRKFKYLVEIIEENALEKSAIEVFHGAAEFSLFRHSFAVIYIAAKF